MRPLPLTRLALCLVVIAGGSPAVAAVADDLCAPSADPCVVNSTLTIGTGAWALTGGGLISGDSTIGFGSGGVVVLNGRDVVTNEVVRANGGSMGSGGSIAEIELRKPSAKEQGDLAALRQAVIQRLDGFSLPLPAGERCTARIDVEVPAVRKDGTLSLRIRSPLGDRDSDNLKFRCAVPGP
jgi:hypothetical protein